MLLLFPLLQIIHFSNWPAREITPSDTDCNALFDEIAAFQLGAPEFDDMALLVMQITDGG
jgi:hypothetical protein